MDFVNISPGSAARVALFRILLAAIPLCALTGIGVWYYETERIETRILEDSVRDAEKVTAEDLDEYYSGRKSLRELRGKAKEVMGEFVSLRIQDANGDEIVRETNARSAAVSPAVWDRADAIRADTEARYEKLNDGHRMTVITAVPVKAAHGKVLGYVKGIYVVPDAVLAEMTEDAVGAVLIAVLTVVGSMSIVFPIILFMQKEHAEQTRKVLEGNAAILEVLGNAIAHRDSDTDEHNYRVTIYALELASHVRLPPEQMRILIVGAFLHDVGKIGISDAILLKQGKLTAEEFNVMKDHVRIGIDIVSSSPWLSEALPVVAYHHEKFDGTGYPNGLANEAIPLVARIFSIADVFDALTSKRPYKEPVPVDAAIEIMNRESGRHFDPTLMELFAEIAPAIYHRTHSASHDALRRMMLGWIRNYALDGQRAPSAPTEDRSRGLLAAFSD